MTLNVLRFGLALSFAMTGATMLMADEVEQHKPITEAAEEKKPSISNLVKKLNSDDFLARQVASQKLAELGVEAFPELEKAAQNGSLETISQVMIILNNHYQSKDEKLSQAAKESLEKIAAGNNATSSERAKDILKPVEESNNQRELFRNRFGPGGFGPGNFPIPNFGQAGGSNFRKQVSTVNGERKIHVMANGKEIDIREGADGIVMKVTENGKSDQFKASNAADLKTKFPEAFKIYEQYLEDNVVVNGGNVQFGNIFGGGGPRINIGADLDQRITEIHLNQIEMQLQNIEQRLKQLGQKSDRNAKDLRASIEQLQTLRSTLSTAMDALRKDQQAAEPLTPPANPGVRSGKPQANNDDAEKIGREIILENEKK